MTKWTPQDMPDLTGRTALVTGANSGIGVVEARELAKHGADVVLAVRKTDAGEQVADRIRATGASGSVRVERLDLASLDSVRELAARFEGPLDLLVNNAGVMTPPRYRETQDGHELQFGTNHLGHFALTALLLPHLLQAHSPRVTTVSSLAHNQGDGRILEASPRDGYNASTAYGQSKLANLIFALELQRRATAAGSPLTSNAAHPGVSSTNLFGSPDGMGAIPVVGTVVSWGSKLVLPGPEKGAEAVLYAATVAEPGSYTGPTGIGETRGAVGEAKRSHWANDHGLASALWDRSEDLTGVTFSF
ncbi:MAG: oxidoreductase [Ornithinibacter sp.]